MGAAAYGGKGFKARASGERPIGGAIFRQPNNKASCHPPRWFFGRGLGQELPSHPNVSVVFEVISSPQTEAACSLRSVRVFTNPCPKEPVVRTGPKLRTTPKIRTPWEFPRAVPKIRTTLTDRK